MAKLVCEVPRWQLLKAMLNNLNPTLFLENYKTSPNAILVDVRTFEEFNRDHLPTALHLDYLAEGFLDKLETMDKDAIYFVYCQSCRRSTRTCILLRNSGFKNLFNLDGGLNEMNKM